jgi:hypothetical protein
LEKAKQELASAYGQNLRLKSISKAAEAKARTLAATNEIIQAKINDIIHERNEYQKQSETRFLSYD